MRSPTSSRRPPQGNASNGSPRAKRFLRSASDGLLSPVTNPIAVPPHHRNLLVCESVFGHEAEQRSKRGFALASPLDFVSVTIAHCQFECCKSHQFTSFDEIGIEPRQEVQHLGTLNLAITISGIHAGRLSDNTNSRHASGVANESDPVGTPSCGHRSINGSLRFPAGDQCKVEFQCFAHNSSRGTRWS
jgi:hypothetical protein